MDILTLLSGIISSIIATIILAAFAQSRGWIEIYWSETAKRRQLHKRLDSAGITNFYSSREEVTKYRGATRLIDYLSFANESIDIFTYWLAQAIEMEGIDKDLARLVDKPKNVKLTIAIIDPTSANIEIVAQYLGFSIEETRFRAQNSLYHLWQAKNTLPNPIKDRFRIKVYSSLPTASVFILDKARSDGKIQIDIKAYRAPRNKSFVFEFQGKGKTLYELCCDTWIHQIEDSDDFIPEKHLSGFQKFENMSIKN